MGDWLFLEIYTQRFVLLFGWSRENPRYNRHFGFPGKGNAPHGTKVILDLGLLYPGIASSNLYGYDRPRSLLRDEKRNGGEMATEADPTYILRRIRYSKDRFAPSRARARIRR